MLRHPTHINYLCRYPLYIRQISYPLHIHDICSVAYLHRTEINFEICNDVIYIYVCVFVPSLHMYIYILNLLIKSLSSHHHNPTHPRLPGRVILVMGCSAWQMYLPDEICTSQKMTWNLRQNHEKTIANSTHLKTNKVLSERLTVCPTKKRKMVGRLFCFDFWNGPFSGTC